MKILDVFGKSKKAKNQKDDINNAADESAAYQLPYFMDDNPKKKSNQNEGKKVREQKNSLVVSANINTEEKTKPANLKEQKPIARSTEAPKNKVIKPVVKNAEPQTIKAKTLSAKKAVAPKVEENKSTTKISEASKTVEKKSTAKKTDSAATEAKKSTDKKANTPKVEDKKLTTKKADAPKVVEKKSTAKKADAPKVEENKSAPKKTEAPKAAEKKPATKKADARKVEENKSVPKKADTPKAEVKKPNSKKVDAPKTKKEKPVNKINDESIELNDTELEVVESKAQRNGKFEIKKSKDGRYVFNLYASNNIIVATSQVYSSSSSAINGINSVIENASTSPIEDQTLKNYITLPYPKWEIYRDKGDQFRFRLSASNGYCICHSQGYTSKASCKNGIESIIKFASGADIEKSYLDKQDN